MLKEKLFFIEYVSTLNCRATVQNSSFCVEFAFSPRVHKGFPPLRTPTENTCKKNRTLLSVPDQDARFTWSQGAYKLPTAPGRSWRKDGPGWEKGREKDRKSTRLHS